MNLLSKKLVVLATATCLVSSSVFALTKADVDAISQKMASVKVVEAPATAAKLITQAEKWNKEATAVEVVKSVAANQPTALKKVIVVVLTRVPEATESVIAAALEVAPKSASTIVEAAAEANPGKLVTIAGIARSRVPSESLAINRAVALAQLHSTPVTVGAASVAVGARPTPVGGLATFGGGSVTQTGATFDIIVTNYTTNVVSGNPVVTEHHEVVTTTNVVLVSQDPYGGVDPNRP
ncbi:MAG TPA: hypothetical protein VMF06_05990 [Candidatus Limnocylindria bacterium]|jgi:hypothetical protein|nr:hypothetical protein [Candidatus Limnocylindria bacterium]